MQLLTGLARVGAIASLFVLGLSLVAHVAAHPPPEPDHGLNNSTFPALWSGDADDPNTTEMAAWTADDVSATAIVANGTDIPFSDPPEAVEQWNRGDLTDFPATNASTSVAPPNATLADGQFIRDAHATIFAIQPATRTKLSTEDQRHYVAPEGDVLGTIDYRVETPPNDTSGPSRQYWHVRNHSITETTLIIDGQVVQRTNGSRTPSLTYDLSSLSGNTHTVTLSATITTTVWNRREQCTDSDNGTCRHWRERETSTTENITVSDSRTVRSYELGLSGFYTRFPDGDLGLLIFKNEPWGGYELSAARVNGVWRFYTVRDDSWDQLVRRTDTGAHVEHSPLHPLQVVAYPIRTGPTVAPSDTITLTDTYGDELTPPTLPATINLDTLSEPYTASHGLATRIDTTAGLEDVTAHGLVRGVSTTNTDSFSEIEHRRSNLTLSIINQSDETATVQLSLRDAATGDPINTADRGGSVTFGDETVATNESGLATQTVPRTTGSISARYEPGNWWQHNPSYTGDRDVVAVQGTPLEFIAILFRLAVPVSLFCLAVFMIDRITHWQVWPFWRRL